MTGTEWVILSLTGGLIITLLFQIVEKHKEATDKADCARNPVTRQGSLFFALMKWWLVAAVVIVGGGAALIGIEAAF